MELNKQNINGQNYEEIVKPLPVTIVRPGGSDAVAAFINNLIELFLGAFIIMLVTRHFHEGSIPAIPPLGYWDSALLIIAMGYVSRGSGWVSWTRSLNANERKK